MEYGYTNFSKNCDDNFFRHVGYKQDNSCIQEYFSLDTVKKIKEQVTQLTLGVDPKNRPIVVSDRVIYHVMSQINDSFRPQTGDIFTRYIIPSGVSNLSYVNDMINQVIEIIVSDIKTNTLMEENNKKLSAWTTVYGDFNEHNLRQHPIIKVQDKRPEPFQFNMNY